MATTAESNPSLYAPVNSFKSDHSPAPTLARSLVGFSTIGGFSVAGSGLEHAPNRIWWPVYRFLFLGLAIVARPPRCAMAAFRLGCCGRPLGEEFTVINNAEVPALWVEIIDESNVPGYRAAVVRSVSPRNEIRWRESAVCLRRGQFHLGPWSIRTSDPFGIFTMTRRYPKSQEIIIHPPIHGQLPIPLPLGESSGRVRARQRSWQATVNAASVRDYQPHDPLRWIHWPTSARRGELFVRQFDLDAAGDIWILLDLKEDVQLGHEALSTEEHAVLLAASLAARAIRQNRAVGLAVIRPCTSYSAPGTRSRATMEDLACIGTG